MTLFRRALAVALVSSLAPAGFWVSSIAAQAALTPQQRVAAIKQSLQDSQARLRNYEWIETTIISLKGEEKARKQQRCYYGADGKLQKIAMEQAPQPQPEPKGRRRGRIKQSIVEKKKKEMQEYMERAAALIHRYVPPVPAQIQKVKDAGKLAITPLDKSQVRLEFSDYLQAGDRLALDVDAAVNTLTGVNVSTYLDKREDVVALAVRFDSLADGTRYTAQTTLDAKAKDIRVVIENSGHRPMAK